MIRDGAGNLYGTTVGTQFGTVFKLAPDGTETTLYSFCSVANCADGDEPAYGLIMDSSGNLYGTTIEGGSGCQGSGCGTVFKVAQDGTETVLYTFLGGSGGAGPASGLILDANGNLYGEILADYNGFGEVYEVAPNGVETVLYVFKGEPAMANSPRAD